jgi:hypothetical protein
MANVLGTLSPDVLALDCLDFLKKKFPILTTFATDFSDEPVRLNTHIISRVVTPPPVQSFTQALGYNPSSGVTTDVSVSINQFRYAAISFYDDELSSTPRNLVAEQVEAAAYSLGKDITDQALNLLTNVNFSHNVVTSANFTRSTLTAARATLRKQGANPYYVGVLNSDAWQYLMSDQTMINTFMLKINDQNVSFEDGHVQGVSGFRDIWEYADLNLNNTTVNGFFGSKNALVMAGRVPSDPAAFVSDIPVNAIIKNVMDEDTGITLQYRYHYDVQRGRLNMILTWIFGVALGVSGHGTLVTQS